MKHLSEEWLIAWANNHCKTKDEVEKDNVSSEVESANMVSEKISNVEITENGVLFDSKDFSTLKSFSFALGLVSKHYANNEDGVIVRYAKPEDKETKEVRIQFQVLKEGKK